MGGANGNGDLGSRCRKSRLHLISGFLALGGMLAKEISHRASYARQEAVYEAVDKAHVRFRRLDGADESLPVRAERILSPRKLSLQQAVLNQIVSARESLLQRRSGSRAASRSTCGIEARLERQRGRPRGLLP
jgi:hypothetical protein